MIFIIIAFPLLKGESARRAREGLIIMRMHNPNLNVYARQLRKNLTEEERHLWYDFLNGLPVRFLRKRL